MAHNLQMTSWVITHKYRVKFLETLPRPEVFEDNTQVGYACFTIKMTLFAYTVALNWCKPCRVDDGSPRRISQVSGGISVAAITRDRLHLFACCVGVTSETIPSHAPIEIGRRHPLITWGNIP
jgi:hypothetical protein